MSEQVTNIPAASTVKANLAMNNDNQSRNTEGLDKREVDQTPAPRVKSADDFWDKMGGDNAFHEASGHQYDPDRDDNINKQNVEGSPQRRRATDVNPNMGNAQVTQEYVNHHASELAGALQQIEQMYQQNELSPEQYQAAMQKAGEFYTDLRALDVAAKTNEFNIKQSQQQFHDDLGELLPEWQKPSNRDHIRARLTNFVGKYGISPEELKHAQLSPKACAFLAKVEKQLRPASKQLTQLSQARKAEQNINSRQQQQNQLVNHGNGIESMQNKVDKISDLLAKNSRI